MGPTKLTTTATERVWQTGLGKKMPPDNGGIFLWVVDKLGGDVGNQSTFQVTDTVLEKQFTFFESLQLKIVDRRVFDNVFEFFV